MKNTFVLPLLGALLVGAAGLWWFQSRNASGGGGLAGPAGGSVSAAPSVGGTPLEAVPAEQRGALATPEPEKNPAAPALQPSLESNAPAPVAISGELDPATPSDASSAADLDQFELKWGEAKVPELKAAYEAYSELYRQNRDGLVSDKTQMLKGEDLERLGREVAWLKEKAFGGG
jgi:hypothetical protein